MSGTMTDILDGAALLAILGALLAIMWATDPKPPDEVTPTWVRDGQGFEVATCPAHYSVYVDEGEALEGKDATHCVREVGR